MALARPPPVSSVFPSSLSVFAATLSLSGLPPDESYTLSVWTVDQAGHVSPSPCRYTWDVLTAVPSVHIQSHPAPVPSSWRPSLSLPSVWGVFPPAVLAVAPVALDDQGVGAKDL